MTNTTMTADAAIIEAWNARAVAFATLPGLRSTATSDEDTPEEKAQWAIIDAAEQVIHAETATTPRGAELQLWTSLYYLFLGNEQVDATHRCDLDWFLERAEDFDWSERLVFAALRSLRGQGK